MMLACGPRTSRLAAVSFFSPFTARSTSTSHSSSSPAVPPTRPADDSQDSIFTAPESPWDHVFEDIDPVPPLLPPVRARLSDRTSGGASLKRKTGNDQYQGLVQRSSRVKQQRASLTAREMSVFEEMFDMIFNAVSAQDGKSSGAGSSRRTPTSIAPSALSFSGQTPSIGGAGAPLNDIFRTLRRHTSRVRWTTAIDEELDRKKETMELFDTDHELLQWVMQEVFVEAQRWDEEAKRAITASSAKADTTKAERKGKDSSTTTDSSANVPAAPTSSTTSPASPTREHLANPSIYPHLIAHAMRIFRTTYSNPSLSLAIFNHAARVSIPSYVFGCTAPAYNELIEAKWEGWGDLEGVCNALEEMRANGVKIDGRTRIVVEKVRREVGEARPVESRPETDGGDGQADLESAGDVNPLAKRVWRELKEAKVMHLLQRIERLALRDRTRKSTSSPHEESWKGAVLQPAEDDGWSFGRWDEEKKTVDARKRGRKQRSTTDEILDGMRTIMGAPRKDATLR